MTITTVLDRYPKPPCADLLGWTMLAARQEDGWVRIGFDARHTFCNPAGNIQGGFLAAMLDDTMGPAVVIATDGVIYPSTIDMTISFLAPARPGPLTGEARVVQLGKTIAFLEGQLFDGAGKLLARATASARLMTAEKVVS